MHADPNITTPRQFRNSGAKHTPAPWGIEPDNPHKLVIWRDNYGVLAEVFTTISDGSDEEHAMGEANAHLIAAAPEMYDLLASIENDAGQVPEWLWNRIQAVLKRARGE